MPAIEARITVDPPDHGQAWLWVDADRDNASSANEFVVLDVANGFAGAVPVSGPTQGTRAGVLCNFKPREKVTVTVTGCAPVQLTMNGAGHESWSFTLP